MELTKAHIEANKAIDRLEVAMIDRFPLVECPLTHEFADGMYKREIFMPAGCLVTSLTHKTKHFYFVLEGKVSVFSANDGEQLLYAGDSGTTMPNTRRALYIHEDCRWVTVHACSEDETVDDIEARIIESHDNDLIDDEMKKILFQLHRYGLEVKEIN